MLENHAVTRTIHLSNKSNSHKQFAFCPYICHQLSALLLSTCPPTNHYPHLLRQEALHKDTPPHHSASKTECVRSQLGIPAHTRTHSIPPVLLNYYTCNIARNKTFCFYQATTFHKKRIYTCKIDFPDLDEIPHICFCEHNWFQQQYRKSCHQNLFDHASLLVQKFEYIPPICIYLFIN